MTWIKYVLVAYFFLILALISREFSVKSCISSNVVHSLDIHGVFKIYNCSAKLDPEGVFTSEVSKSLAQAKKDIVTLEEFLYRNNLPYPQLKSLDLSFTKSSSFPRDLVSQWVDSINPQMPQLYKAIYGDIFTKIMTGSTSMDRERTDSLYLISERDACGKGLVLEGKYSYCELIKKNKKGNFEDLSYWSLRPMLYAAFLQIYETLDLKAKQGFLKMVAQESVLQKKYSSEFDIRLDTLVPNYHKLTKELFHQKSELKPLAYVLNFQTFSPVTSIESLENSLSIHGEGAFFYKGEYQTRQGRFRSEYAENLPIQREIWVVDDVPPLRDLMATHQQKLEIFKIGKSLYRVHIPSLGLLFKLKMIKPYQNLDGLDKQISQVWLGFNPVETVRN